MKPPTSALFLSLLFSQLATLTYSFSTKLIASSKWTKSSNIHKSFNEFSHSSLVSPLQAIPLATAEDIIEFASETGVSLSIKTLGPGYRAVARAKHNETQVIGYCNGFIRPVGQILHMDKMEVFKPALVRARAENPEFTSGGTVFGVGLLLGCLCLTYGLENNCKIAEFLAIDDGEKQHKRLVRHYKRLGLNVIRYVGEDILNVPDRLIWGGVGTLMNAEIVPLLERWSPTFLETISDETESS